MKRALLVLLIATLVGCGTRDERAQSKFTPATEATVATTADYDAAYLLYPVQTGAWLWDVQAEPRFIVDRGGAKIVPPADRRRLASTQAGTVLSIPTLPQFNTVESYYGSPAANGLVAAIDKGGLSVDGEIKISDPPQPLVANTEFDGFVAVRVYVQRTRVTQPPVSASGLAAN